MDLTFKDIRKLMEDLEKSSLRDFSIQDGDFSLHLSKNEQTMVVPPTATIPVSTNTDAVVADAPAKTVDSGQEIKAPMVGTVYLKPKPDQPNFKQVGDHVEVGETVAIIEAMKLMTDIKSDISGTITDILVKNEEVVDYDKPLFRVATN